MTVHTRHIRGALAFWDTHRARIVDAFGHNVVKFIDDFVGSPQSSLAPTRWTATAVGSGTAVLSDGSGGKLLITAGTTENDGHNLQALPEAFELTSDQDLFMGFYGVTINDVDQTDVFLGLSVTDTAILGGVTDRIGFQSVDADAGLDFALEKDSTETLTEDVHTLVDATAVDLEFAYSGSEDNVRIFIDGAEYATIPASTNIPDDEALAPSIEFLTGEAVANTLSIDKVVCIQIGR